MLGRRWDAQREVGCLEADGVLGGRMRMLGGRMRTLGGRTRMLGGRRGARRLPCPWFNTVSPPSLPPQESRGRRTRPSCPPITRCRREPWARSRTHWAGSCRSKDGLDPGLGGLAPPPHVPVSPRQVPRAPHPPPGPSSSSRSVRFFPSVGGSRGGGDSPLLEILGVGGDGGEPGSGPRAPVNWGGTGVFFPPTKAGAFAGKDSPCTPSLPAAFGTPTPPSP